jgi:hypothetical protein
VDKAFLKKLTNLRGMIELEERKAVPGLTRVENWAAVELLIKEADKKIKSDKKYVKRYKKAGGDTARVNWKRKRKGNHYSWNLLLFSGS